MKRWITRMVCGMMAGAAVLVSNVCDAGEAVTKTLSPYFFVEGTNSGTESFPLKNTDVKVQINGVIADVVVKQTYANEGQNPINAKYVFPASTRAAVQGMTMTIGNKIIRAKIKEKVEAQKEFDEAKKSGKSASLLTEQRPNVFTMNVANIMPKDVVDIELHYTELLVPTEGVYEFMYPTVVGPRYSSQPADAAKENDQFVASPYVKNGGTVKTAFNITTQLSTGLPLHDVKTPSHETDVTFDRPSVAHVTLKNKADFGGNRDYVLRYRLSDNKIQSGLMLYKGGDENFFLLTVQPPKRIENSDIPPREYIFVVDVSGSMNGFPLDVSKEVLKNLIGSLRPTDMFNVVLFSGGSKILAPSSVVANKTNIKNALSFINEQNGGGGTELLAALNTALNMARYQTFSRSVVLVTDGYIDAEKAVFDTIHQNLSNTNVFAFGIGSSVNRYLIEGIAHAGMGEPFIVTTKEEAEPVSKKFVNYVKSPVLKDIRLNAKGFDVYDLEPQAIPDMFGERPIVVVGKWKGEAKGTLTLTGNGGHGIYQQEFKVADAAPIAENAALKSLWARTKIGRLSDFLCGRDDETNKSEITALGLKYSLLTKYTSFIAVHDVVRNPKGDAKDVNQPLPLPQGVSDLAVGEPMTSVPEPELWFMAGLAVLGLVIANGGRVLNTFRI